VHEGHQLSTQALVDGRYAAFEMRSSSSMLGKGMCRCRQRRLRASETSRVLLLVRNTSGVERALTVPISGIETW
jgi:hypothetical protein